MSIYTQKIKEYVLAAKNARTHAGKMVAFSELLKSIFGVSSYEIVQNIEQYVKTGGLMHLRGRMDMRLGQTIIEFKIDLSKELDAGKEEIERYTTILRKNGQKVAECLITDGVTFKVFVVREKAKEVRTISFEEVTPEQAIMFLDTFLFSGRKVPTADDLNMRFGPGSPIFEETVGHLTNLFKSLKEPIKFSLWSKNMQLVYGSTPPEEAFVSQTYLMILLRLLLAKYLVKVGNPPTREALDGKLFDSQGINIIEDDFFAWILTPLFWSQVKPIVDTLTDALDFYDLEAVDEDIFKEIYQEIVRRGERHRIGEYYTPEWLAELTLQEAITTLDPNVKKKCYSILDPACGSGTFLTNAISILKKKGCSLEEIIDNVYGMDLNPIAVTISRANYLLALGKLIEKRKGSIFIPVFMADSINLPSIRKELVYGESILAIDVDKKTQLNLPLEIALEEDKLKSVLAVFTEILSEYQRKKLNKAQALRVLERSRCCGKKSIAVLQNTLSTIIDLIDENRDSVWVFMMRNIYAPLRMKEKSFDLVVGNPPWISLRYIDNRFYQDFLKKAVFRFGLLKQRETTLFTQMDTSTVFYAVTADCYLAKGGILAFVMPRSVLTGSKQHAAFKEQKKPLMKIIKVLDFEKVNPLFNVDSCSIIAKSGETTTYPVPSITIKGSLPEKNMLLRKAIKYLTIEQSVYSPPSVNQKKSSYHDMMQNGAGIYPRTLFIFKFVAGDFGISPDKPSIESLVLPDAKEPWGTVVLRGEIEQEFIFATMLSKYILPFRAVFFPVVLPIGKEKGRWKILSSEDLINDGKFRTAEWTDRVQVAWHLHGTVRNLARFPRAIDYVNYNNKLIDQKVDDRYYVVYTASGSNIAGVVVDTKKIPDFVVGSVHFSPQGFVPDHKTYYFSTNCLEEAHYLSAILNSNTLNERIKKIQTRGKFGPRDIHRRPFEFNIPMFDSKNVLHVKISALGEEAAKEAAKLNRMSRFKTKVAINSMKEIDELVIELLESS